MPHELEILSKGARCMLEHYVRKNIREWRGNKPQNTFEDFYHTYAPKGSEFSWACQMNAAGMQKDEWYSDIDYPELAGMAIAHTVYDWSVNQTNSSPQAVWVPYVESSLLRRPEGIVRPKDLIGYYRNMWVEGNPLASGYLYASWKRFGYLRVSDIYPENHDVQFISHKRDDEHMRYIHGMASYAYDAANVYTSSQ